MPSNSSISARAWLILTGLFVGLVTLVRRDYPGLVEGLESVFRGSVYRPGTLLEYELADMTNALPRVGDVVSVPGVEGEYTITEKIEDEIVSGPAMNRPVIFIAHENDVTVSIKCRKIQHGSLEPEFEILNAWWSQTARIAQPLGYLRSPNCIVTKHMATASAASQINLVDELRSLIQSLQSLHASGYMFPQIRRENIMIYQSTGVARVTFAIDSAELPIRTRTLARVKGTTKSDDMYVGPSFTQVSTPRDNIENLVYVMIDALAVELPWRNLIMTVERFQALKQGDAIKEMIVFFEDQVTKEKEQFVKNRKFFAQNDIPDGFRQTLENLLREG
jgi:hypothetical protein